MGLGVTPEGGTTWYSMIRGVVGLAVSAGRVSVPVKRPSSAVASPPVAPSSYMGTGVLSVKAPPWTRHSILLGPGGAGQQEGGEEAAPAAEGGAGARQGLGIHGVASTSAVSR